MNKAKITLSAFMALAMAFTASAPVYAEKVSYKNDVSESYYSSLLEITNGNNDEKYYNRIASEPEKLAAVLPAGTVRQFGDNCLILFSTDLSSIPDEIRKDKSFDLYITFELYVSDEVYYNCTFSLLERQAVTAKELRRLAEVPENETVTAVKICESIVIDSKFQAADYEAFWEMIYTCYVTDCRSTACKSGSFCDFGGKKYCIKADGSLAQKSCTIKGIRYKISENGECLGKYTGWTKSDKGRRYYKNGKLIRNKWIKTKSGKRFYAGSSGYIVEANG
ncbi:MAG: hypothetical protein ACI4J4_07660 [Ruminiclostridium sp.]